MRKRLLQMQSVASSNINGTTRYKHRQTETLEQQLHKDLVRQLYDFFLIYAAGTAAASLPERHIRHRQGHHWPSAVGIHAHSAAFQAVQRFSGR